MSYLWAEKNYPAKQPIADELKKVMNDTRHRLRQDGVMSDRNGLDYSIVSDASVIDTLTATSAQVVLESTATYNYHNCLIKRYLLGKLQKYLNFQPEDVTEEDKAAVTKQLKEYRKQRKKKIIEMLIGDDEDGDFESLQEQFADIAGGVSHGPLEFQDMMTKVFIMSTNKHLDTLVDTKRFQKLVNHCFPSYDKSIDRDNDKKNHEAWTYPTKLLPKLKNASRLSGWLYALYAPLLNDDDPVHARHEAQKERERLRILYSRQGQIQWAAALLAIDLLPQLLSPVGSERQIGYVRNTGQLPFFTNATVVQDQSLCNFLSDIYQKSEANRTVMNCMVSFAPKPHDPYPPFAKNPKAAHMFVKQMTEAVGLRMRTTNQRIRTVNSSGNGSQVTQLSFNTIEVDIIALAAMLALKHEKGQNVRKIIQILGCDQSRGTNLTYDDHKKLLDAVKLYNDHYPDSAINCDITGYTVATIPRRLAENERDETNAQGGAADQPQSGAADQPQSGAAAQHYSDADRDELAAAYDAAATATTAAEAVANQTLQSGFQRNAVIGEGNLPHESREQRPQRRRNRHNQFIDDIADDEDDEEEEEEEDEEDDHDDDRDVEEEGEGGDAASDARIAQRENKRQRMAELRTLPDEEDNEDRAQANDEEVASDDVETASTVNLRNVCISIFNKLSPHQIDKMTIKQFKRKVLVQLKKQKLTPEERTSFDVILSDLLNQSS